MSLNTSLETRIQVMFFDTDAGGVVHNIAYLRFIETARTLLAVQLGMDWELMKNSQVYPVVVRTEIDYKRPALLGDDLIVQASLGKATGARFWCHFKIVRPQDEAVLVTSQQSLAFVKMPEQKLMRLAPTFPNPFIPLESFKKFCSR